MWINDCKGEYTEIKWAVGCSAQKTNQRRWNPAENDTPVSCRQQMVLGAPRVPQMWVRARIVPPASSPYSRERNHPQRTRQLKTPFCRGTINVWHELPEFGAAGECQRPPAPVSPPASEVPAIPSLPAKHCRRLWENRFLSNASSTFLPPELKSEQLQGQQLQPSRVTQSERCRRWVAVAAPSPALSSCFLSQHRAPALALLLPAGPWMAAQHIEVIDSSWLSHNLNQLGHLIFPTAKESCRS